MGRLEMLHNIVKRTDKLYTSLRKELAPGPKKYVWKSRNLLRYSTEWISPKHSRSNNPDYRPVFIIVSDQFKKKSHGWIRFICSTVRAALVHGRKKRGQRSRSGVRVEGKHGVMAACRTGRGDELGRCSGVIGERDCVDMQRDENR